MIRAIVRNGTIEILGPLPTSWKEGRQLVIEEVAERVSPEAEVDAWAQDVEAAMAAIPNEDHDLFEAALALHEKESKELVRRQWDLD